jgi:succinoglycan biosynthesis protein ExoA
MMDKNMKLALNSASDNTSPQRSNDGRKTGSVLVVIPSLNEAEYIAGLIAGLLTDAGQIDVKIVVADGGSSDGTCEIIEGIMERDKRVVLLSNKMRIAPSVNDAVAKFGDGAEFLIRIDAHAEYPHEFCARLLEIQAKTGADSVAVSMHTIGRTCFQRAAAAAQNSFLGNGGSLHRNASTGRWVDHGHHALMRIAAFRAVGGYDKSFIGNEDAELDFRLRASGFRIYLAAVSIMYHSRGSAKALFRQYFNYGLGRAMNVLKHRQVPKIRQMLPLAVAPAICLLLLIPISPLFAIPALLWGAICICYGLLLAIRTRDACVAGAGAGTMTMHAGWSFGFFNTLLVGRQVSSRTLIKK